LSRRPDEDLVDRQVPRTCYGEGNDASEVCRSDGKPVTETPGGLLRHLVGLRHTGPAMTVSADRATGGEPIVVRPATIERFDDIEPVINRSCWCQWWRETAGEFSRSSVGRQRAALREQCAAEPVPGVVAYLGDLPVGWCGFGPRSLMRRLERSRTIPAVDDLPVWSIVCFDVRPGYRRRGVAKALLAGAIEYARAHAVVALEAYATDPGGTRRDAAFSFTGFTSMFEAAGFRRVVETASHADRLPRWLMRLDLADASRP
jgi:GNAT superfamily N-acetyltransferase